MKSRCVALQCSTTTILDSRNFYIASIHFIWFKTSADANKKRDSRTQSKEMFLTFTGFMHALHVTQYDVANEFRDWVEEQVCTLAYGTAKQKKEMKSTLWTLMER